MHHQQILELRTTRAGLHEFTDQVRAIGPSPFALRDAIEEIEVPNTDTGAEMEA